MRRLGVFAALAVLLLAACAPLEAFAGDVTRCYLVSEPPTYGVNVRASDGTLSTYFAPWWEPKRDLTAEVRAEVHRALDHMEADMAAMRAAADAGDADAVATHAYRLSGFTEHIIPRLVTDTPTCVENYRQAGDYGLYRGFGTRLVDLPVGTCDR